MKKTKAIKVHTGVYLDPEIVGAVQKICKEEDRSFTKQIERILKDWLTEHGHLKKEQ